MDGGFVLIAAVILGCILGWVLFRYLARPRRAVREGFQEAEEEDPTKLAADLVTLNCPPRLINPETIKTNFWRIVDALRSVAGKQLDQLEEGDVKNLVTNVGNTMSPGVDDTFQVIFPLYISVYALASYSDSSRFDCARRDLFDRYDTLLQGLTQTVYDQSEVAAWSANPKEKSCAALSVIEQNFKEAKALMRARVQDVSGMSFTLADLRDENMDFQKKFEASCKEALSQPCIQLASQEPILFPLLAKFDVVSATGYEKEGDINETLTAVGKIFSLLECRLSAGTTLAYDSDRDSGEIDSETLRMKLQSLSPYYLSPDVLKYITEYLISPEDVQDELMNTSDIFARISTTNGRIRTIAGLNTAAPATAAPAAAAPAATTLGSSRA